ncbi:hypothetical protein D3C80_2235220 [compost metagenome]
MVERVDRQTMANYGAATSKYRGMSVAVDLSEAMDAASLVGVHSADEPGMG